MAVLFTPAPGNVRYCAAMLPAGANLSNAGVSYQPFAVVAAALELRTV